MDLHQMRLNGRSLAKEEELTYLSSQWSKRHMAAGAAYLCVCVSGENTDTITAMGANNA